MTQEVIDIGVNADDGTGDSLYEAGQKINSNFTELFAKPNVGADVKFFGNNSDNIFFYFFIYYNCLVS